MVLDKNYDFEMKKRSRKKKFTQQGDNIASEVTVSYDPSLIKKRPKGDTRTAEEKRIDEENEKRLQRQSLGGSQLSGLGLESSLGKDQRKFQLQALIDKKEVITLQSAMQAMSLAKGTIITYLREMDLQLYDAKDNKFVGAKEGKKIGID